MFYLILFIYFLICSIFQIFSYKKNEIQISNTLYYSILFLLIIFGGFRFETGGDWPGYGALYERIDTRSIEPLFTVILWLSRLIGDYQWIFVFCELIRFIIMAIILEEDEIYDNRYKTLFILLYYVMYWFYYDLVIIRQSTAAAIFALGVIRKKRPSYKKYLLYVVLASGFHYSSLILVFFYYPLYMMKKKNMTIINLVVIGCYLLGFDFLSTILKLVLGILPQTYLVYRLWAYTQIKALATARVLSGQSLVYLLIFFIMLFNEYKLKKETNRLFFNGCCIFIFFYFGFPSLSTISTRLSTNFSIFVIFIIIDIIKIYRKTIFVPVMLVGLCFCFNKGVFFELPDKIAYNPYQFYWTHKIFNLQSDGLERLNAVPNYDKNK